MSSAFSIKKGYLVIIPFYSDIYSFLIIVYSACPLLSASDVCVGKVNGRGKEIGEDAWEDGRREQSILSISVKHFGYLSYFLFICHSTSHLLSEFQIVNILQVTKSFLKENKCM